MAAASSADRHWQHLSKARRAAVYRAVGRAGREAREAGDEQIRADLRIAIGLLRAHAVGKKPAVPASPRRKPAARRRAR
jgi:hypothetical protein